MSTTTPNPNNHTRSTSHGRSHPPSRPTTPLRPTSRSSLRISQTSAHPSASQSSPLEGLEPAFAELSDAMADLEANFMHLQLMHESLSRFSENFAAFLYGLNMNAFCVDFPEAPIPESFKRAHLLAAEDPHPAPPSVHAAVGSAHPAITPRAVEHRRPHYDVDDDVTIMTTASSFVDHPAAPSRSSATPKTPTSNWTSSRMSSAGSRGGAHARGAGAAAGRGAVTGVRGTRASQLAHAAVRGRVGGSR